MLTLGAVKPPQILRLEFIGVKEIAFVQAKKFLVEFLVP